MLVDEMHTPLLRCGAFAFTVLNKATVLYDVVSNVVIMDTEHLLSFLPWLFELRSMDHGSLLYATLQNARWGSSFCIPDTCWYVFLRNGPHILHKS